MTFFESSSSSILLREHDLFRKTGIHFSGSCSRCKIADSAWHGSRRAKTSQPALSSMRGDNEIAGMKVGGDYILQQHAVMVVERDQRVAPLLGFGEIGKGSNIGKLPDVDLVEPRGKVGDRVLHRRR